MNLSFWTTGSRIPVSTDIARLEGIAPILRRSGTADILFILVNNSKKKKVNFLF
jgi:hypothetical protein